MYLRRLLHDVGLVGISFLSYHAKFPTSFLDSSFDKGKSLGTRLPRSECKIKVSSFWDCSLLGKRA